MEASVVDLRYHMKKVFKALKRNEKVYITNRGKKQGLILPILEPSLNKAEKHAFFGMQSQEKTSVDKVMENLRGKRYRDL